MTRFGLGTLVSVVSLLGALATFGYWLFGAIEWTPNADRREASIRYDFKAEIANVRGEENRRGKSDLQKAAWAAVQSKRIEVVLLRNRVNDCNAKKTKSEMETNVCKQYDDEFAEATRVYTRLQTEAVNASRGD